jgi:hypothetical protein
MGWYAVRRELPLQLLTVIWKLDGLEADQPNGLRKLDAKPSTKLWCTAHLAQTERHIRQSERHLLHQRQIVDELERHGRGNSKTANITRDILVSFEMAHAAHIADRAHYREALEQPT